MLSGNVAVHWLKRPVNADRSGAKVMTSSGVQLTTWRTAVVLVAIVPLLMIVKGFYAGSSAVINEGPTGRTYVKASDGVLASYESRTVHVEVSGALSETGGTRKRHKRLNGIGQAEQVLARGCKASIGEAGYARRGDRLLAVRARRSKGSAPSTA